MRIFFSVGEPSGDIHGANLVRELRDREPELQCCGFGGPRMAAAGCELEADLTQLAIMWFSRAVTNLPRFWSLLAQAQRQFRETPPDAVILIDYPGFNWWVARKAKACGIPVIYYGAPQMWAWAPWRVRKMRRLVDHVLCKLPFEANWYQQRHCPADYVGHPFFDDTRQQRLDEPFVSDQRRKGGVLVTLLPGSRTQEVQSNLPTFLRTAERVHREVPEARFAVASFNQPQADWARQLLPAAKLPIEIHVGRTRELIDAAHCCLACSGSVSLELLHYVKPTVIHYRVSRPALGVQALFRRVKYITLVNLLAVPEIYTPWGSVYDPDAADAEPVPFPEYLASGDRSRQMAGHLVRWLRDPAEYAFRRQWLSELRTQFGAPGATRRAAETVLKLLSSGCAGTGGSGTERDAA